MRSLITGITGQDGAYLSQFLLDKGYEVYGIYRRLSTPNFWRLQYLGIYDRVNLIPADLIDMASILEAIRISNPDEIYHLAAQSLVGASFEQPLGAAEITALGTLRILEAIRLLKTPAKFYNAATSELFGKEKDNSQTEDTPFSPASPYSAAKQYGYSITKIYREAYNIFACNGILFNHESPLRGLEFVTRKVSNAVAKIYLGIDDKIQLGNLDTKRDWGYAPEYVEAMWLMMQQERADDFIIATNETHTVRELCEEAFGVVGLDWEKHVGTDERFKRPLDVYYLRGDNSKAKAKLGWTPKVKFKELIKIMVTEDVSRWERWQDGERFPWDAPNYSNENKIISRMLKLEK